MEKISIGYVFGDKASWDKLEEGHGVVVISDGKVWAYGQSHDARTEEGADTLKKNLAGAQYNHKGKAYLVKKVGGRLDWRNTEGALMGMLSKVLPGSWRQKKFNFGGQIAAQRRG